MRLILVGLTHAILIEKLRIKCLILTIILVSICQVSCSTSKKNTPATRQWEAFNTRYNVFYNGKEHFNETLSEMERSYEDDYTKTLMTHPAAARGNDRYPQPSGDFTRTIEKMQKAIQLHSITRKPARRSTSAKDRAFRAREEFNPFLHNAWLLMGEAQYYNGDFLGAASTFLYVSKHFFWLPDVVTEARLWQARCYCALNWIYEAENLLYLVKEKDLVNNDLRLLFNIVNADYLIKSGKSSEATTYLRRAAEESHGSQKNRLWFLLGQIYENLGEKQNAYQAFKKAGEGVSTSYRTKFNSKIKQSEVFSGREINSEVKSLQSMTKYERNKEYLDQIYYAIGNLYLSRKDTVNAIKNYRLAVENSMRQGIDMAFAEMALGNIYFNQRKYIEAQSCYSQAFPFIPDNYPDYNNLKKRSDILDELATYAGNVQLQDSLLNLGKLPKEEQIAVARSLAYQLIEQEKRAKDDAQREEFLSSNPDRVMPGMPSTQAAQTNTDKSWYFYNNYAKSVGKTEFQKKWGSRKLEDDWRRKNKLSFAFDEFDNETDTDNLNPSENEEILTPGYEKNQIRANDPHYPEYYLKQIPQTPEEIEASEEIIEENLYNMGLLLKDYLEDYEAARHEFLRLLSRFPHNPYELNTYYNLYMMAARENHHDEAEKWRQEILKNFPESEYGIALRNPDYFENLRKMHQTQEAIYERAYAAYLDNKNDTVHLLTREMEEKYPLSPILPKFVFIDALSYFTEGDNQQFQQRLVELLQKWPESDMNMTDMASSILRGIRAGRTLHGGETNLRGMIWNTPLSNTGEDLLTEEGLPVNFENNPDSPQYFVLAFPLNSVNPNALLYDVAKFNFSSFLIKDFDLEQMSFSDIGLLIVKGFDNQNQLNYYRTKMQEADLDFGSEVIPIMISKSNFEILLREGKTFEEYFRFMEETSIENSESFLLEEIPVQ